ncbi:AT hook motif protein, putative [Medicago truncatula]|uniref:AT hook motif protein, putative n=1 Tax=Medicago truncatula TaxID=3880 RepID=G7INS8_MEDTR|nr:AT hook motif protein, putative [Medicago truncatula]
MFTVIYTIEFQKCGLPHAHILVFLKPTYQCKKPEDLDKIISAEIPNKDTDGELFNIVTTLMIHGPCGDQNTRSPCMLNNKCSKHFPMKFVDQTVIDKDGYPVYKRRDNGVYVKKGECFADNRFVVPYNKTLLLKYKAHINVEWCNQIRSIKYLFKYVNKGHDRVTANFYGNGCENSLDEIKMYYDCRYLSACEAAWRIFSFDINYREPSVERLNYHLENEHSVLYEENDDIEQVIERSHRKTTKFLAWMKANEKYPEARNLTYNQFPTQFVWKEKDHEWTPRRCGFSIGRVHFAPPGSGERFYLRTLLNYIKGPTSFNDIKTVDDVKYNTFKEACFAMGLLDDDKEFIDAIIEASLWGTGIYLRRLFVALMVTDQFARPEVVWNSTNENLIDDILHKQRRLLGAPG